MIIKTKLSFSEYIKLIYLLTYRKWWIALLTIWGVMIFIGSILSYFKIIYIDTALLDGIFGALITFGLPLMLYITAKRNFSSNKRIQEEIEYEFTGDRMILKGSNFSSELGLNEAFKIEEIKKWFLIYQSKQTANFIPKANLNQHELYKLREIFKGLVGVKVKLKR